MASAFQVLVGVVIGVFLASNCPDVAAHIRDVTLTLIDTIQGIIL